MPSLRYHRMEDETILVEIDWNARWSNMEVRVRGQSVGVIANRDELASGRSFPLSSGEELQIRKGGGLQGLPRVSLNGVDLYPLHHDPKSRLYRATMVLFVVGGLLLFLGLRPLLHGVKPQQLERDNLIQAGAGLVYLCLGGLAKLRSITALVIALVLLILSTFWGIYGVVIRAPEDGIPLLYILGFIIQLGLVMGVYQGIGALRALNRKG